MIQFYVEDYCQTCADFEPVVEKFYDCSDCCTMQHVHCEHSSRCRSIYDHIQDEFKKEKNDV